ncbi:MAG: AAA family ATPase [Corynebacterium sp.]|nr:AAA family ATPase [Corynebacterium sp.]
MRFHSIELFNVRGIKHLKLDNIPATGVVVVHGPNEAGKSTIAEAINMVLNVSYRRNGKDTRALEPVHESASPRIVLGMSAGDYRFVIDKQYLKSNFAVLRIESPRPETLKDNDAEARLAEILGAHTDKALFDALMMRQSDAHDAIKAAGIPVVGEALSEFTAGEESADNNNDVSQQQRSDDSELMQRVQAEYTRYFTLKSGQPSKELKDAISAHDTAQQEFEKTQEQMDLAQQWVDSVAREEERIQQAHAELPDAREELSLAQLAMNEVETLRGRLENLKKDEALIAKDVFHLNGLVSESQKRQARLDEAQLKVQAVEDNLPSLEENAAEEAKHVADLEANLRVAKEKHGKAWENFKALKKQLGTLQTMRDGLVLQRKVAELDSVDAEMQSARTKKAELGPSITDADVSRAEDVEREWHFHKVSRDAAATKFVLSADEPTNIHIDGQDITVTAEDLSVELSRDTHIKIGAVSVTYVPGAGVADSSELDDSVRAFREQFDEILQKFGCGDIAALRNLFKQQEDVNREISALIEKKAEILDGEDADQVRAQLSALDIGDTEWKESDLAKLDEEIKEKVSEVAALEEAVEEANHAVDAAEARLTGWQVRPAQDALVKATIEAQSLRARLQQLQDDSAADTSASEVETSLEQQVQHAQKQLDEAQIHTASAAAELAAVLPEERQQAVDGAVALVRNLEEQLREAENSKNRLMGQIAASQGVAEKAHTAQAAWERAAAELESVRQRADAAKLLWDTLTRHRQAARERYAQPFARRLSALASRVFGAGATVQLDEDLAIESRSFGSASIPLDDLSGGAREQMAILSRFAIADLIAESKKDSVPVIIDDALGSADNQRIRSMSALFADAGRRSQVIVLTCEPSRYHRVPGAQLVDIETLKQIGNV